MQGCEAIWFVLSFPVGLVNRRRQDEMIFACLDCPGMRKILFNSCINELLFRISTRFWCAIRHMASISLMSELVSTNGLE